MMTRRRAHEIRRRLRTLTPLGYLTLFALAATAWWSLILKIGATS